MRACGSAREADADVLTGAVLCCLGVRQMYFDAAPVNYHVLVVQRMLRLGSRILTDSQ